MTMENRIMEAAALAAVSEMISHMAAGHCSPLMRATIAARLEQNRVYPPFDLEPPLFSSKPFIDPRDDEIRLGHANFRQWVELRDSLRELAA
jgi:hypothetical protein